ncbi:hypothetical protein A8709_11515 [Paenibacillus pectinilyticus]|uniref:Uncharacterized protein n=1 Tax=Paenibacillus pectinilyticus TaxID=512399 RepID=A0A1C1A2N4_9BACL|nr:hypothetical protein [Paenibacillus pectinilyticus]OCT14792.1 hypothetical protein A8709_11515 [Paenibacillus pectinilyticus]
MAHAAEIERVKTLLRHAKQLSGDSIQANERIKSLSTRLEALQQLQGENTSPVEQEIAASEEASVEADPAEEQAGEQPDEQAGEQAEEQAAEETAAQAEPDQLDS